MKKELSQKGKERLLQVYIENNLEGNNIFPPFFITLSKYGYAETERVNGNFIRRVTPLGIDYLKRHKLI